MVLLARSATCHSVKPHRWAGSRWQVAGARVHNSSSIHPLLIMDDIEYGDITSEEAVAFCLQDAEKARADTLALTQVRARECGDRLAQNGTHLGVSFVGALVHTLVRKDQQLGFAQCHMPRIAFPCAYNSMHGWKSMKPAGSGGNVPARGAGQIRV